MSLIRYGFSIDDLDRLGNEFDQRFVNDIFNKIGEEKEVELLTNQLYIAEAVQVAIIGTMPGPKKNKTANKKSYQAWVRQVKRKIAKIRREKIPSWWDRAKGSFKI